MSWIFFDKSTRSLSTSKCVHEEVVPLRKQLKDEIKAARAGRSHDESGSESFCLDDWELTVGIEIHAQLNTPRKLFSRGVSENEGDPNSQIADFDIALPGSQPVFQVDCLLPAIRAALALKCDIQNVSNFDRKHYFYHDQPAGYQITQYYHPFARGGRLTLTAEDGLGEQDGAHLEVGLKQIQLEQDTAKTQELEDGTSIIDFNRSGQPLIEIISLPHIHSPQAAVAYMRKVQSILYAVDAVTTGMELGGLRADVNVSVKRIGDPDGTNSYSGITGLGQRTEIKNLSSFKAVEDAIKAERDRQIFSLSNGIPIQGETRGWSSTRPGQTRRLRGKEGEVDYRYMPDPDIPPLRIQQDIVQHLKDSLPAVPDTLTDMLVRQYGLSTIDARTLVLLDDGHRLNYFQEAVGYCSSDADEVARYGVPIGNWVLQEVPALFVSHDIPWTPTRIPPSVIGDIVMFREQDKLTNLSARKILEQVFNGDSRSVADIATAENLWFERMSNEEYIQLARQIIDVHSAIVEDIRKGKHGKMKFLMGQMMRTGDRNRMEASKAEAVLSSQIMGL